LGLCFIVQKFSRPPEHASSLAPGLFSGVLVWCWSSFITGFHLVTVGLRSLILVVIGGNFPGYMYRLLLAFTLPIIVRSLVEFRNPYFHNTHRFANSLVGLGNTSVTFCTEYLRIFGWDGISGSHLPPFPDGYLRIIIVTSVG